MSNLRKIRQGIEELEPKVADLEVRYKESPTDFSIELQLQSVKNMLNDLHHQLYLANLKREKEIVELRLLSNETAFGSIPLDFVGGITNNFSAMVFNTSKYLKFGRKGGKRKEKIVQDTIDLRLEAIGRGSTIFYLSAKTSPDLFGYSVVQNALESSFNLFDAGNIEQITENISNVGSNSIKFYSKFLLELNKQDVEIDVKWQNPDDVHKVWEGRKDNIQLLYNTLNQLKISEPEDIPFEGELITISSKGKFEVVTEDDIRIFGNFSHELLDAMKEFHIGDICSGVITKTTIYNPVTEKEKVEYNLKSIL
jgi:hypothetical protein